MDSESTAAIAHHHGSIPRETQLRDTAQAALRQPSEQLIGGSRRERELELFARRERRYRFTHCAGPVSNPRPFQMSVCTSTVSRVIVQTFTACGRCPRERLDTVPATE